MPDAHHDIKPFEHRIDHTLGQLQLNGQVRILRVEGTEVGYDVPPRERRQARHAQSAADTLLQRRHRVARFIEFLEDARGPLVEKIARLGADQRPRGAGEQRHAHFPLQHVDLARH
ncbi:hypothetical protein D3C71_1825960 [compost metagenome]